jgi:hypothetical protein
MRSSNAICLHVVSELHRLMRCQFAMAALSDATLDALPSRLLTAQLKRTKMDAFLATWAAGGVLCAVVPEGSSGAVRLVLRLSVAAPVPVPPLPAGEAAS